MNKSIIIVGGALFLAIAIILSFETNKNEESSTSPIKPEKISTLKQTEKYKNNEPMVNIDNDPFFQPRVKLNNNKNSQKIVKKKPINEKKDVLDKNEQFDKNRKELEELLDYDTLDKQEIKNSQNIKFFIKMEKGMIENFATEDANNDGILEIDEFAGSKKDFQRIDRNEDGFISFSEILYNWDRQILQQSIVESEKNEQRVKKDLFESLDANSDGMISVDEYKGPKTTFNRFDKDKDGFLYKSDIEFFQ